MNINPPIGLHTSSVVLQQPEHLSELFHWALQVWGIFEENCKVELIRPDLLVIVTRV